MIKWPKVKQLVVIGVAGLWLLAGCAGIGKPLETPRISLADIRVEQFTGFETVFQIRLRVLNSNDVDITVKGLEAELEINDRSFAAGVSDTAVKIPAFGTELVPLTVYSSVIDMFKSVYGLQKSENLKYRLKGKLRASGGNAFATVLPFESKGVLTLNEPKQ